MLITGCNQNRVRRPDWQLWLVISWACGFMGTRLSRLHPNMLHNNFDRNPQISQQEVIFHWNVVLTGKFESSLKGSNLSGMNPLALDASDPVSPTRFSSCSLSPPFILLTLLPSSSSSSSQLLERSGQDIPGHLHPDPAGCPEDPSQNHRHCGDALHVQGPALQVRIYFTWTIPSNWVVCFLFFLHDGLIKFPSCYWLTGSNRNPLCCMCSCELRHSVWWCREQQQWWLSTDTAGGQAAPWSHGCHIDIEIHSRPEKIESHCWFVT